MKKRYKYKFSIQTQALYNNKISTIIKYIMNEICPLPTIVIFEIHLLNIINIFCYLFLLVSIILLYQNAVMRFFNDNRNRQSPGFTI